MNKNPELKNFDRNVPQKPRAVRGVKGHNINEITLPGSSALSVGGELHIRIPDEAPLGDKQVIKQTPASNSQILIDRSQHLLVIGIW
jgi:hypothetical protein